MKILRFYDKGPHRSAYHWRRPHLRPTEDVRISEVNGDRRPSYIRQSLHDSCTRGVLICCCANATHTSPSIDPARAPSRTREPRPRGVAVDCLKVFGFGSLRLSIALARIAS